MERTFRNLFYNFPGEQPLKAHEICHFITDLIFACIPEINKNKEDFYNDWFKWIHGIFKINGYNDVDDSSSDLNVEYTKTDKTPLVRQIRIERQNNDICISFQTSEQSEIVKFIINYEISYDNN